MEKKKLDTSYINKAVHKIENIFKSHPIKNDKGEIEGEQSRLDQLGNDNSDGYSATRDLRAFLKFYKTLDEYSRYLLRTKLVVKTGYDIDDIKKYLDLSNDGGEFTPEYYNYWINSLYESVNNKDKSSNKYINSFREAVEKLEEMPKAYVVGNPNSDSPEARKEKQFYTYNTEDKLIDYFIEASKYLNKIISRFMYLTDLDPHREFGINDIDRDANDTAKKCINIINEFLKAYEKRPVSKSGINYNVKDYIHRDQDQQMM